MRKMMAFGLFFIGIFMAAVAVPAEVETLQVAMVSQTMEGAP